MDAAQERERRRRGSSQKSMLSKALQKANTAVLLDNAANYEGAIDAYSDACELLMQVMRRTEGRDEQHKLEEIRNTYTTRIAELGRLGLSSRSDGKALPDTPLSEGFSSPTGFSFRSDTQDELDEEEEPYVIETATVSTRILDKPTYMTDPSEPRALEPSQIPPRRQSLLPSAFDDEARFWKPNNLSLSRTGSSSNLPPLNEQVDEASSTDGVQPIGNGFYDNSPSRRPPLRAASQQSEDEDVMFVDPQFDLDIDDKPTSWLDNGDSGGSSASSTRSRSSSLYLRKRDHVASGGTEAAFDAALDAAVEAAYNEGLEPVGESDMSADDDVVLNVRRNVERAKQKVREAELEAEAISAKEREKRRVQEEALHGNYTALDANYEDGEAEEEELILEEMMDVFEFDVQSKSALPRQSGSSGYSGRTWGSSIASNAGLTGTSLSTLAEEDILPSLERQLGETLPARLPPSSAPTTALPPPPPPAPPPPPPPPSLPANLSTSAPPFDPPSSVLPPPPPVPPLTTANHSLDTPSVRERRLSGLNPKELMIEINTKSISQLEPSSTDPSVPIVHTPLTSRKDDPKSESTTTEPKFAVPMQLRKLNPAATSSAESLVIQTPVTAFPDFRSQWDGDEDPMKASPHRNLNQVSSAPEQSRGEAGLKNSKSSRGKKLALTAENSGKIPESPFVAAFSSTVRKGSSTSDFNAPANKFNIGSHTLFDDSIHSPMAPGHPNPSTPDAPIALEPCPQSFLLRPFWLMRCLYQSIAHPRGAYLTRKLFLPRDVWRVKNVKIKAMEEKVANCDLLTAALLKLAQVDTNDADAILEEMQSLENIFDQVQTLLTKKLGNEVGVHGAMNLLKTSPSSELSSNNEQSSRSTSGGSKSYLTSWRKIRSKSSGPNGVLPTASTKDTNKDTFTLPSLPMNETLNFRPPKRNAPDLNCTGPNANYMNALARLCDAAQIIDQIARQVEDPGLKHSSQTLVGLELSTRHASEFFGFYVCRFALNDIGLMLDKFVKRGSEWVLV